MTSDNFRMRLYNLRTKKADHRKLAALNARISPWSKRLMKELQE